MANQMKFKETRLTVGDIIRVHQKDHFFEGKLISIRGRSPNTTFTVRRIGADNIGVERIFPLNLPSISKIEVKKKIPSRRAKLYYLRP